MSGRLRLVLLKQLLLLLEQQSFVLGVQIQVEQLNKDRGSGSVQECVVDKLVNQLELVLELVAFLVALKEVSLLLVSLHCVGSEDRSRSEEPESEGFCRGDYSQVLLLFLVHLLILELHLGSVCF